MEANGFKQRLQQAKDKDKKIKIIFQYPASSRAIIKSGHVVYVFDDCFNFQEVIDGLVTYSYDYIVEIKEIQ